jgi:hypothetical protein
MEVEWRWTEGGWRWREGWRQENGRRWGREVKEGWWRKGGG